MVALRMIVRALGCNALAFLVIMACSDREHGNPFDPENPSTQGRPITLTAIPGGSGATLYWDIPDIQDLEPGRIMARLPDSSIVSVLEQIEGSGYYRDNLGGIGRSRTYWLEVPVAGWNGIYSSDTSAAVTSGGDCWIAYGYDHVAYVSADASIFLPEISLGSYLVDISYGANKLWAIGTPSGFVYGINTAGGVPTVREQFYTGLHLSSCAAAPDGRLLLAHRDGLLWYDPTDYESTVWHVELPGSPSLIRLAPGNLDLWVWDSSHTVSFVPFGASEPAAQWMIAALRDMVPISGRRNWLCTESGLILADADTDSLIAYDIPAADIASAGGSYLWATIPSTSELVLVDETGLSEHILDVIDPLAVSSGAAVWVTTGQDILIKIWNFSDIAATIDLPVSPWVIQAS